MTLPSDEPARSAYDAHYAIDNDLKTGDARCVCGWQGWDLMWHKAQQACEAEVERLRRDWTALRVLAWGNAADQAFRDAAKIMLGEPDA